jgi:hypothetical protein
MKSARTRENSSNPRFADTATLEIRTNAQIDAQDDIDDQHLTPELIVETVKPVGREIAEQK